MTDLVSVLRSLNRKERFWLLNQALGGTFSALDRTFRENVADALHEDRSFIPPDAWWAFDYHLDWIAVGLTLYGQRMDLSEGGPPAIELNDKNGRPLIRQGSSNQDADLVIVFDTTIIAIEAKADGSWSRSQMGGKIDRLSELNDLAKDLGVSLRLVLCSPGQTNVDVPADGDGENWPDWTLTGDRPAHMTLQFGGGGLPLYYPTRIDYDGERYQKVRFIRKDRPRQ